MGPNPQSETGNSLPEFLAARARASSDSRLAADAIGGLLLLVLFSIWRIPAWYLLAAIGACFLCYGLWAIANRELAELAELALSPRKRLALRVLSRAAAALGWTSAAFLMLATLAKIIGPVIS